MVINFHIVWTVLVAILFVGIVVWAMSSKRKRDFDEAARLPLDDDQPLTIENLEKKHG